MRVVDWILEWGMATVVTLVLAMVVIGVIAWGLVAAWQSGTWVWVYPLVAVGLAWWWHSWDVGGGISDWLHRRRAS